MRQRKKKLNQIQIKSQLIWKKKKKKTKKLKKLINKLGNEENTPRKKVY